MSRENAEIVRRVYDLFNARDTANFLALLDADVDWLPTFAAAVEGRAYRGHDGVRRWLGELDADWDEFLAEPDEVRDAGEQVLVLGRLIGTGKDASVPVEQPSNWLWELKEGSVVSLRAYTDRAEAIAAFEAER